MFKAYTPYYGVALVAFLVIFAGCHTNSTDTYNHEVAQEITRNESVKGAVLHALAENKDSNTEEWRLFKGRWSCNQHIGFRWNKDKGLFVGKIALVTGIADRYVLRFILDFVVSPDYKTVQFTSLNVNFNEVASVRPTGGSFGITFNPESDKWFGLKELRELRGADWNFSKIGIMINSNAPVEHFQDIVNTL